MNHRISHKGEIIAIDDVAATVRVMQTSACSGCKIADKCRADISQTRLEERPMTITIPLTDDRARWNVGQTVNVTISDATATWALLFGFGLPLLAMVLTVVAAIVAGAGEGVAGLLSIAVLIPYYVALWLMRSKLDRRLQFSITKI